MNSKEESSSSKPAAEDAKLPPFVLTGLHCCGDLGSTMLRLFAENPCARALVLVSCCYNLLSEGSVELSNALRRNRVCGTRGPTQLQLIPGRGDGKREIKREDTAAAATGAGGRGSGSDSAGDAKTAMTETKADKLGAAIVAAAASAAASSAAAAPASGAAAKEKAQAKEEEMPPGFPVSSYTPIVLGYTARKSASRPLDTLPRIREVGLLFAPALRACVAR